MDIRGSFNEDAQIKNILQKLQLISSKKALDVATGDGVFIRLLMKTLKSFNSFTGIDTSEKNLRSASRRSKRNVTQFIKMDARDLDFSDNSFDLISISESLHHIEEPQLVLKEIYRVIQPDGIFILQESISNKNQEKSRLSDALLHEFISYIDVLRGLYHRGFFEQQEIVGMVQESGFKKIDVLISKISLKCALCKYLDNCNDSMSKKMINKGLREVTRSLRYVIDHPQYSDIKREASLLRDTIRQNGYSPASIVFIIAQ
ncbi:MAG: class I SAM-dependent methyltransferase [Candidatus Hodarchaeota archaeon]